MNSGINHNKFLELRSEYPSFEYQSYSIKRTNQRLEFSFLFTMGDVEFRPSYSIPLRDFYRIDELEPEVLDSLVFHIGMVELVSYWKAACPPKVIVKPHALDDRQIAFWKKLYFNGLGEFFYLNGIRTSLEDFMHIEPEGEKLEFFGVTTEEDKVMVPVGGGKDSVVTLELLKHSGDKIIPMAVNPREAVVRTIETAGFGMEDTVVVNRKLDKKLLELNELGFLNGHTPFSALLAFVTLFSAVLSGIKYVALSNESSANESTVPGSGINHQYSKSFEFELDFVRYVSGYMTRDVHYFSFLRPLNELQIGALFSRFPQHHLSFRSCNAGSKNDTWCGYCPKCLFTRIILGPFIDQEMMRKIFGKELLDDVSLERYFDELTGKAAVKPFECVGTPDEVTASLGKIRKQWKGRVPALLERFELPENGERDFDLLLCAFNKENNLPEKYMKIIQQEIKTLGSCRS